MKNSPLEPTPIKQTQLWQASYKLFINERQDQNSGKYYMLEEHFTPLASSRQKASSKDQCLIGHVSHDGSAPRYCDAKITGFSSFKRRVELSLEGQTQPRGHKSALGHMPRQTGTTKTSSPLRSVAPKLPKSTYQGNSHADQSLYVPRQDKFDGYFHFRSPMVLPYTNRIDPHKVLEAKELKKLQKSALDYMVDQDRNDNRFKPSQSILSERNKLIIKTFAEKLHKLQTGQPYDVIGSQVPHFTGTRTGFNIKAKSYRDQAISSITKYLPQDDYNMTQEGSPNGDQMTSRDSITSPRGQSSDAAPNTFRASSKDGGSTVKKLTKAQREALPKLRRIEKIKQALIDNQSGKMVHGFHLKNPIKALTSVTIGAESADELSRRASQVHEKQSESRSMSRSILKQGMKEDVRSKIERYRERLSISEINNPLQSIEVKEGAFSPQRHSLMSGFATIKEHHAEQPNSLIKPFFERSKIKNQVSVQGELMLEMNADEIGIQPPRNFAQTSQGTFRLSPRAQGSPVRTAVDARFIMNQKQFDEDAVVANSIVHKPPVKATTKGLFGGPHLSLKNPAQCFSLDKEIQQYTNPVASLAEKVYLERDRHLLEKRRYARVLKEIQCEQKAGVKGVTKMPQALLQSIADYEARHKS